HATLSHRDLLSFPTRRSSDLGGRESKLSRPHRLSKKTKRRAKPFAFQSSPAACTAGAGRFLRRKIPFSRAKIASLQFPRPEIRRILAETGRGGSGGGVYSPVHRPPLAGRPLSSCRFVFLLKQLFPRDVLRPRPLAVMPEDERHLHELIRTQKRVHGDHWQLQHKGREEAQRNGVAPHIDDVALQAKFAVPAGAENAADQRGIERGAKDIHA